MRRISLWIVLAMLISLFAACGASEPSVSASAVDSSTVAESPAPEAQPPASEHEAPEEPVSVAEETEIPTVSLPISEEPITLTYWTTVNPQLADIVTSLEQCKMWNYMAEITNIQVDGTLIAAQSGNEKFALMVASGDYTDLLDSPGANYTTGLQGALDDDVLLDLTEIVESYMPNYASIISSNEEYEKGTRVDDGRIGMIYGLYNEDYVPSEGPVIRQDWLDALNLETPVTYDDLHDVLTAFKENYGATMWIPYSGSPLGNYLGAGYGIATTYLTFLSGREPFYQVDGTVHFGPMEDAYYDYLVMLNQWYQEGLIWSDFYSYTERFNAPPDSGIISGQFGVWFSGYSNFQVWSEAAEDPNFHIVAFTDPVMNEGDTNHLRAESFLVTNGGVGISSACEYVEEAAKLIDYWFSDEGRFLLTFGFEGETFEYDADGHPQYTDLIKNNPDGLTEVATKALYIGGFGFHTISDPNYIYLDHGYTQDQIDAPHIWISTSDCDYGIPGTVSMTVEESTENSALLPDIGTYVSTWMLQAVIGEQELTPETFADFRATLTQMNIETVIGNKQAALDRYNQR
ncbi:MAG: extracellular solute-binding protein [Oscillospiraceae bacterium]|nr:extracellular solute-binding protein [Oscillospiraceae bacterium]